MFNGLCRIRTYDLPLKRRRLYRLANSPRWVASGLFAERLGRRPPVPQTGALPLDALVLMVGVEPTPARLST